VPVHRLDDLDRLREQAGDAKVSVQVPVALLGDERERSAVTELVARRFGSRPMGGRLVVGTAPQLAEHFAGQRARGVERFYAWFIADFAPVGTLQRFAEVIRTV
jgi:hypothetical protein